MVNFKENYHFSRFQGVQLFPGGGGGGANCLFPIETHITCDFPGGSGPSIKKTAFTDFKEEFVNRIREKEKKKIKILRKAMVFWGRACFGWVDRSTANQHFFRSVYFRQ